MTVEMFVANQAATIVCSVLQACVYVALFVCSSLRSMWPVPKFGVMFYPALNTIGSIVFLAYSVVAAAIPFSQAKAHFCLISPVVSPLYYASQQITYASRLSMCYTDTMPAKRRVRVEIIIALALGSLGAVCMPFNLKVSVVHKFSSCSLDINLVALGLWAPIMPVNLTLLVEGFLMIHHIRGVRQAAGMQANLRVLWLMLTSFGATFFAILLQLVSQFAGDEAFALVSQYVTLVDICLSFTLSVLVFHKVYQNRSSNKTKRSGNTSTGSTGSNADHDTSINTSQPTQEGTRPEQDPQEEPVVPVSVELEQLS